MSSPLPSNLPQEAFLHWLAESNREIKTKIALDTLDRTARFSRGEDGEIGVFSAEKYFNGEVDSGLRKETYVQKKNIATGLMEIEKLNVRIKSPSGTSVSSIPSHTALVSKWKTPEAKRTKTGRFFRAICKCSCAGGDAVDVANGEASPAAHLASTASFRFNQGSPVYELGNWMNQEKVKILYPPKRVSVPSINPKDEGRDSLEVFGSPFEQRKTAMILPTWAAVGPKQQEETEVSASSGICNNKDDDSDASSDLIEIESMSGKVISYFAKQDSTASGCVTPATCYAPSETSIEWSVVTASAANASVVSDQEAATPTGSPLRVLSCSKNVRWRGWSSHREPDPGFVRAEPSTSASSRFMRSQEVPGSSDQSLVRSRHASDMRLLYV